LQNGNLGLNAHATRLYPSFTQRLLLFGALPDIHSDLTS
jgi:hypothetical protein